MSMQSKPILSGFTLIELLLYVSIAGVLLTSSVVLLSSLLEARIKGEVIAEVEEQGYRAVEHITQSVRNADAVTAPSVGNSGSSLSLQVSDGTKNPTVFSVASGVLRMQEGSGTPVPLTNAHVTVSDFTVRNLSVTNAPDSVRISFTLSSVNAEGRVEYDYERVFYGSASVR